jgi:hypothetical protein
MAYHEDTIEEVKPVAAVEPPVVNLAYDMPPVQFVAGTVVPKDTPPEEMTDPEYVQWCADNRMPYWAIKKEIVLRNPPVVSSIEPSTAAIGDPSFSIFVTGENFHEDSIIVFAGQDEPTQLNEDGTLSTGVNMGVWHGPDVLPVTVRNGSRYAEPPAEFTFTAAPEADAEAADDHYGDEPVKRTKKKK